MLKSLLNKHWPHLVAILVFVALGLAYFTPVTQGKVLNTHDKKQWLGMAKETMDFREMEGEEPLWTNSMFGGMPTFMISTKHDSNLFKHVNKFLQLGLPHPVGVVFLYMLGFYILMMAMKVDPWLGILGSVMFAFTCYNFVILDAGHNSKAFAIAYMAPVLAGVVIALRGKYILGFAVTAAFLALQISANHLQITYYLGMAILIFLLAHFVEAVLNKQIASYAKSLGVLGVAALFAVLTNASALWTSLEYAEYTTRGQTELTIKYDGSSNEDIKTTGLDKKYVTDWSLGIQETWSLIIPNAKGGASATIKSVDKSLAKKNASRDYRQAIENSNHYWGNQSIVSGPVYIGIITFYLFVLGLFFKKGYLRWAVLAVFLLTIMLSWGKNFMGLTEFFLDNIPGYNKFRAVTIILSVTAFVVPLLGILGLKYIIDNRGWFEKRWKMVAIVSAAFLVPLLILAISPDSFLDFASESEVKSWNAEIEKNPEMEDFILPYSDELMDVRISIFKSDLYLRLVYVILSIALILAFVRAKINAKVLVASLAVLVLIDLWSVDKRYLNNGKRFNGQTRWVKADKAQKELEPLKCDEFILGAEQGEIENFNSLVDERIEVHKKKTKKISQKDRSTLALSVLNANSNYRVFSFANPFNESRTSFFHKSIGGYHGAKLKRYKELIEFHIVDEVPKIQNALSLNPSINALAQAPEPLHILNMLNTKYVILDPNRPDPPLPNPNALGNAWFVNEVEWMENSDDEITTLEFIDPSITALVDKRYKGKINDRGGPGSIYLESYKPNHLIYQSSSTEDGIAIFSEIFYDAGWQAYIDDNPVDHVRANYLLRALNIPAGDHKVEFIFEPKSFKNGSLISMIFSSLIILLILWLVVKFFRSNLKAEQA